MSVEAAFVVGLVLVVVFVLFPPVLRKLNQGAELAKGKSAIVSAMGEKRGITYIDYSGTVYLAAPDIVVDSLQLTIKNLAIQTASDAVVKGAVIKFATCTGPSGAAETPTVACGTGECCQVYNGATNTFSDCTSAEIAELEAVAEDYPNCEGTNPYGQPVLVYNSALSLLTTGFLGVTNMSLMNAGLPILLPYGYSLDLKNWGHPETGYAELFDTLGAIRCPLRRDDPRVCCGITAGGKFDLNACGACTAQDVEACVLEG